MAYSDFEKAEAFKDTLEVTFQENVEPYCDDKIEEVENVVCNYFDNFTTLTPPLTSLLKYKRLRRWQLKILISNQSERFYDSTKLDPPRPPRVAASRLAKPKSLKCSKNPDFSCSSQTETRRSFRSQ
ncbi:uncharacterized protein TNCV_4287041 [Trichonephila clavipes]|nr:uncharacterized protein TNCV_4287041 [Trichonephila clavipes]